MIAKTKKKIIIFDYDGVLVNSLDIWYLIVQKLNLLNVSEDDFKNIFSQRENEILHTLNLSKIKLLRLFLFNAANIYPLLNTIKLQPNTDVIIPQLAKDYILAINSSTASWLIRKTLKKYNLLQYFTIIKGGGSESSKVKKFQSILKKTAMNTNNTIFITDTAVDVLDAKEAEIKTVTVENGFDTVEKLAASQPLESIKNMGELPKLLERIFPVV